ncbi:MAG: DUF86 domain-containing protein [Cytophagales bacterium]|nr:MAG: DUF86 domain-containing protein [Cytophagales bacterium]TAF62100.1 MAG: DUF86 domain-containing protein [Cytophagales bacterium]
MSLSANDKLHLLHIIDAIYEVESYLNHTTNEEFLNNSMMRAATVKQMEIMANAAQKVSPFIKSKHPEVPWPVFLNFSRNLVHEAYGINYELVWTSAKRDIPNLKRKFEKLLAIEGLDSGFDD